MAHPTKSEAALIAERRAMALQLRSMRVQPSAIGRKLAADPRLNSDGVAYPMGYGIARYQRGEEPPGEKALIRRVCQDIQIAIEQRRTQLDQAAEEQRDLDALVLEQAQVEAGRRALQGDMTAMAQLLRILERRARMYGYDAPTQLSGTGNINVLIDPDMLPGPLPEPPSGEGT